MHYENADIKQYEGCQFRANNADQAFGHTRCSTHRPCTGNIYWEPDNCSHCMRMEDNLKVLNSRSRYTQLGRIRALLNEVKRKVEVKEPHKNGNIYQSSSTNLGNSVFFNLIQISPKWRP